MYTLQRVSRPASTNDTCTLWIKLQLHLILPDFFVHRPNPSRCDVSEPCKYEFFVGVQSSSRLDVDSRSPRLIHICEHAGSWFGAGSRKVIQVEQRLL